jgi:hypothetical protein
MTAKKPGSVMERKLATIQKIIRIEPIEGADKIEKATVLGWHLVVKKCEFKIGDLCVYCEVDSLMPVKQEFESSVQNTYSQVAKDMQIEDKLKSLNKNIAIQGEIIGPGIQGNLYKLTKHELMVFDIFYIDKYRYYNHNELTKICKQLDLKTVPIISENFKMEHTVDELVEFSNGASILNTNIKREGIVFRSTLQINDSSLKRLSFKVINPEFLLKYEK